MGHSEISSDFDRYPRLQRPLNDRLLTLELAEKSALKNPLFFSYQASFTSSRFLSDSVPLFFDRIRTGLDHIYDLSLRRHYGQL